jgi:hypothetical protein
VGWRAGFAAGLLPESCVIVLLVIGLAVLINRKSRQ